MTYREYGDPNGAPLFFFHGWPGSSLQGAMLDAAGRELGYRVIAPNRPGIGASPIIDGRRLIDWPTQLAALADDLGIASFSVVGVSGGGPYALAAAWGLPNRVISASVVCGAPPIAELAGTQELHPGYRALLWLFRRSPRAVRALFAAVRPVMFWRDAVRFFPPLRIVLPNADAEVIAQPELFDIIFGCQRDAFENVDGLFADAAIYAEPWGFRPEEIRVPVRVWHGREDVNFHHMLTSNLARRIPGANFTLVEGEGHFSLPIRRVRDVLGVRVSR